MHRLSLISEKRNFSLVVGVRKSPAKEEMPQQKLKKKKQEFSTQ